MNSYQSKRREEIRRQEKQAAKTFWAWLFLSSLAAIFAAFIATKAIANVAHDYANKTEFHRAW